MPTVACHGFKLVKQLPRTRRLLNFGITALLLFSALLIPFPNSVLPSANANNRGAANPAALSNGMPANLVLGQSTFTTANLAATATGLGFPRTAAFDSSGDLWVADDNNNRVLRYSPPFTDGMAANLVIGQTLFTTNTPTTSQNGLHGAFSVAFDSSGKLWVTDRYNNRILRYPSTFSNGMSADLVIGQSSFITNAAATSQTGLTSPWNIAFDASGNLWVADDGSNRVLRYSPPFVNGVGANLVIGQSSFTLNLLNQGGPVSATGLSSPEGVAFDSLGNLWVSDQANNRVLRYSPPFSNGMATNLVLGQAGFNINTGITGQSGLSVPTGITFDSSGNLWVAEATGNNRVVSYSPPFANGEAASLVIGQAVFTTNLVATTQAGLRQPEGTAFDSSGNLWVIDQGNNRVLSYQAVITPTTCVQPPSGMVAWWPLDETSGSIVHDVWTGHYDGTALYQIAPIVGKVGGANWFANPDVVTVLSPSNNALDLVTSLTIDAWIEGPFGPAANQVIVSKMGSTGGYALYILNGQVQLDMKKGSWSSTIPSGNLPPYGTPSSPNWHHVAVTIDGSTNPSQLTVIFYYDGAPSPPPHTVIPGPGSFVNSAPLAIAGQYVPSQEIGIDELEIFNTVLDQTQIADIYGAGIAGKCKPTAPGMSTTITTWDTELTSSTTTATNASTTTQTVSNQTTVTSTQTVVTNSTTTWTSLTGSPATYTTTVTNSSTSTSCLPGDGCTTTTITNATSTYTYTVTSYSTVTSTSTIFTSYTTTVTSTQSGGATITQTITSLSTSTIVISSHLTTLTSTSTNSTSLSCVGVTCQTTLPPTSTISTTAPPGPFPKCIIATAAYGSELAGPVQFLRNFRDGQVQKTALGASFVQAFNAWYYSWAPEIAQQIAPNENYKAATRAVIAPLIASLFVGQTVFAALAPAGPELAILLAGLLTSSIIGLVYLGPVYGLVWKLSKRRITKRTIYNLAIAAAVLTFIATLTTGTFSASANLTALAVVETLLLTPALILRKVTSLTKLRVYSHGAGPRSLA